MKTKKLLFGLALTLMGTFAHAQNGLDSIIVEKYYISNAADAAGSVGTLPVGSTTYRLYASMQPGYKFEAIYGVTAHQLKITTTTSFFNNEDRGAVVPNGISVTNTRKNSVMLDTWFSVGATATGKMGVLKSEDTDGALSNTDGLLQNNDALAGIALTTEDGMIAGSPEAVTFVGLDNATGNHLLDPFDATSQLGNSLITNNGSVASLNGSVGPLASNRVLLGQFTTDGQFCFELNVQIGTPTPGVFQNFVAKNPTGNEIQIPSLIGCYIGGVTTNTKVKDNALSGSYKIYPNPAKDLLTVEFSSPSKQGNDNSYTIYGVEGNEILHKTLGTIAGDRIENIDISSLGTGFYFIKLSVDGTISTKKLIKN